jgi:hypothetical protein
LGIGIRRQKAEASRQKAEGRRQKAEGRRLEAESSRQVEKHQLFEGSKSNGRQKKP